MIHSCTFFSKLLTGLQEILDAIKPLEVSPDQLKNVLHNNVQTHIFTPPK